MNKKDKFLSSAWMDFLRAGLSDAWVAANQADMIERARWIIANEGAPGAGPDGVIWAEALLCEHEETQRLRSLITRWCDAEDTPHSAKATERWHRAHGELRGAVGR